MLIPIVKGIGIYTLAAGVIVVAANYYSPAVPKNDFQWAAQLVLESALVLLLTPIILITGGLEGVKDTMVMLQVHWEFSVEDRPSKR